uniref:SAP domain-containing protein n=1 Tax=viral metagenome TaxID=1070528 RepID=A0A6C0J8I0_9ZZZZ
MNPGKLMTNMAENMATNMAVAVLPKKLGDLIKEMKELQGETQELSDRLLDPVHGPLLPFCLADSGGRVLFCTDVTRDIILIAAGGTGFATLAETIIMQPDMVFMFLVEAVIPIIDDMASEGKDMYKNNLDKAFDYLLKLKLDDIKNMTSEQFMSHIIGLHEEHVDTIQTGGGGGGKNNKLSIKKFNELKELCKKYKLKCSGTKKILLKTLNTYLDSLCVKDLKILCKKCGLKHIGNKKTLIDRLLY